MSVISTARFLVADIGGTNARFALACADAQGRPTLDAVRELHAADFPSLSAAAQHYLGEVRTVAVHSAVFAVASPIAGDELKMTNSPWSFSLRALRAALGLDTVQLINDFAAVSYAVAHLGRDQVVAVGAKPLPLASEARDGHYAVLGPGTGLGVGRLLLRDAHPLVLETEGGHVGFAPTTTYELRLLEALWRDFPRVSAERLLSGPGLVNLYRAVCWVEGEAALELMPADISEQAAAHPDGICARTIERFCELFGAFAGDAVLMHGAWHGVYLAGGMTQKLLPWIQRGGFRARFERKGRFEALLQRVPVWAISHPQAGLLGAAACGLQTEADR